MVSDSLVYRYDPLEASDDGLNGSEEGSFSLCSFWLVETLTRAGRTEEARLIFEKMLSYASNLGLYAEQVGDTGEGIPEAEQGHVFEFAYTTREGGNGLGLAMVYHFVVEEHGGRVALESAPGEGTRVQLVLPVQPAERGGA